MDTIILTKNNIASIEEKFGGLFALLDFYFGCINSENGVDSIFYCGPQIREAPYGNGLHITTDHSEVYIPLGAEISYIHEIDMFLKETKDTTNLSFFGELVENFFEDRELIYISCEEPYSYEIIIDYWTIKVCYGYNSLTIQ